MCISFHRKITFMATFGRACVLFVLSSHWMGGYACISSRHLLSIRGHTDLYFPHTFKSHSVLGNVKPQCWPLLSRSLGPSLNTSLLHLITTKRLKKKNQDSNNASYMACSLISFQEWGQKGSCWNDLQYSHLIHSFAFCDFSYLHSTVIQKHYSILREREREREATFT